MDAPISACSVMRAHVLPGVRRAPVSNADRLNHQRGCVEHRRSGEEADDIYTVLRWIGFLAIALGTLLQMLTTLDRR
jgi:hypothetical protein